MSSILQKEIGAERSRGVKRQRWVKHPDITTRMVVQKSRDESHISRRYASVLDFVQWHCSYSDLQLSSTLVPQCFFHVT